MSEPRRKVYPIAPSATRAPRKKMNGGSRRGYRIVPLVARRVRKQLPKRIAKQESRLGRRPPGRPSKQGVGRPGPDPLLRQVQQGIETMMAAMGNALAEARPVVLRGFLSFWIVEIPPQRRVNIWDGVNRRDFQTRGNFGVRLHVAEGVEKAMAKHDRKRQKKSR